MGRVKVIVKDMEPKNDLYNENLQNKESYLPINSQDLGDQFNDIDYQDPNRITYDNLIEDDIARNFDYIDGKGTNDQKDSANVTDLYPNNFK